MISKAKWQTYIQKLAAIDAKAAEMIRQYIDTNGLENSQELIEYAHGIVTKYGEASAELSCEMYDLMAETQGAVVSPAEPADTASAEEVAKGMMYGKYHSPNQIPSIVGRQVRQAGADTMLKNAIRDQAEWAWIPSGDTCAFCITLASRGWQRASKKVLKGDHAEHIHQNCDCTFGIAFNEKGKRDYDSIYDPQKYADMYYSADGRTPTDKINAIRRMKYQQNRKYIRNQQNDAYQAREFLTQPSNNSLIKAPVAFGGNNVEIDELTPCLRNAKDGSIVSTHIDPYHPTKAKTRGWEFDWTEPEKNGFSVFALYADGDKRVQGLIALKPVPSDYAVRVDIVEAAPFNNPHNKNYVQKEYLGVGGHLFAEAVRISYEHGYDGFVYFQAKTNLIKYYEKELGAILINPSERTMAIDERAAKLLFDRYYGRKD